MPVCVEPSTISFLEKMLPASIRDAGVDARATMWDGRPRPSDCRKRLGKMSKLQVPLLPTPGGAGSDPLFRPAPDAGLRICNCFSSNVSDVRFVYSVLSPN